MSFDKIFDLTAGVYFHFYNICRGLLYAWCKVRVVGKEGALGGGGKMTESCVMDG